MKYRRLPRIQIDEKHLPYKWQEKLISSQEIGGVFLLFLSGKKRSEIDRKLKLIKGLCKIFQSQLKDLAKVKPVGDKWLGRGK